MSAQRRIQKCFLFLCPLLYRKARQLPRISPTAYLVSSDLHLFSMSVLVCKFVFYFQSFLSPYRCFKEKSRDNTLGRSSQLPSQAVISLKSFVIISKDIHFENFPNPFILYFLLQIYNIESMIAFTLKFFWNWKYIEMYFKEWGDVIYIKCVRVTAGEMTPWVKIIAMHDYSSDSSPLQMPNRQGGLL